jgi:hypothetical protein
MAEHEELQLMQHGVQGVDLILFRLPLLTTYFNYHTTSFIPAL